MHPEINQQLPELRWNSGALGNLTCARARAWNTHFTLLVDLVVDQHPPNKFSSVSHKCMDAVDLPEGTIVTIVTRFWSWQSSRLHRQVPRAKRMTFGINYYHHPRRYQILSPSPMKEKGKTKTTKIYWLISKLLSTPISKHISTISTSIN